jgi:hypothetical protein
VESPAKPPPIIATCFGPLATLESGSFANREEDKRWFAKYRARRPGKRTIADNWKTVDIVLMAVRNRRGQRKHTTASGSVATKLGILAMESRSNEMNPRGKTLSTVSHPIHPAALLSDVSTINGCRGNDTASHINRLRTFFT